MKDNKHFDVIIIGGSYAGLSAAMALGRSLRNVLVIDSGKPCNSQTPHSHNFLTQDGKTPKEIASVAKQQVEEYKTVKFYDGFATNGSKNESGFEISTQAGDSFTSKKVIFATGVKDLMPDLEGFAACWGISVIHCPYCHGYEYSHQQTGILANGEMAYELGKLISNWTKDLTIFTNGESTLTEEQVAKLTEHGIKIIEQQIVRLKHTNGHLENIVFRDGTKISVNAMYARPAFEQHCKLPVELGCELTEMNHIKVDLFQKTNIQGLFACGDATSMMRSVANSVATGAMAGAMANRELIEEAF